LQQVTFSSIAADHQSGPVDVVDQGPTPKCPGILLSTTHVLEASSVKNVTVEASGEKVLLQLLLWLH